MLRLIKGFTILILLLAITGSLLLTGCATETEQAAELEKVTLLLDWTPNTNYSGLYAALDQGYYLDEGLEVEIIQAPGSVVQMVAAGQAQFGISYQEEVTFARLSEIPVVSIAAIIQHNTSGFASLKEKGILSPADFEGRSYGGWGSPVEEATIRALMEKAEADFSQVDMITTGEADLLIVIEREADFAWIYYGWDGINAELKGLELNFIELKKLDPALDYYTPVLITSETLTAEDPELVERFLRATEKGYLLAIESPDLAAEALIAHAPELDEALVYASQTWLADQFQGDAQQWGMQKEETWTAYGKWLLEQELIEEIPDLNQAFTNQFLRSR
jgi:ABC-type nitrate/sulfonate/bicarbonate transport system substrate-binding protein